MTRKPATNEGASSSEARPYKMRIPGFVSDEDVGLGDVVKPATSALGVRPCAGCEQRAAALSRWFAFTSQRSR